MAILSNEWVLGGVIVGAIILGAAGWKKTSSFLVGRRRRAED